MRKTFLLTIGLCLALPASAQRQVTKINDNWQFRHSHQVEKGKTELVQLPHTWNAQDALVGKIDYKRGIGNYTKTISVPAEWSGKRVFLRCPGANSVATVFVNGKYAGEHRGGYSAFAIDITDKLVPGKENSLLMRVNNAEDLSVAPLVGDFNMYGGLYRGLELIATDSVCISPTYYGSPGVLMTQKSLTDSRAEVGMAVALSSLGAQPADADLSWEIVSPEGKVVSKGSKAVHIDGADALESVDIEIKNPHRWNGVEDPALYTARVELSRGGKVADNVDVTFGLRDFKVDPAKGAFLNGKHVRLKGVCRHQERAQYASALSPEQHRQDFDIIREMGANAVRLAHYQQADEVYGLTDEYGIMTWAEIPFVGPGGYADKGFVDNDAFKDNVRQQLRELISQQCNHPSIVCWGLFNEIKEQGDNPTEFVAELNDLAHQLDPSRPTTAASNADAKFNYITDLIAWNRYDGWYGSTPATLARFLDAMHEKHPELSIAVSEYGAGASMLHQQDSIKQPTPTSRWHPENWQTYYHIENWKILNERPFVWGSFIWNMFDFGAAHRTEGDRIGINDKGLVTHDRSQRKDAFYFYKANWNPEPMVYISGKRATKREKQHTDVTVFANVPEVELWVNGKKAATAKPDEYSMCVFGIDLVPGANEIEARAAGSRYQLSDSCVWNL